MSDPSKSREMKERWRDPEYRARATQALQKASEIHAANRRSSAEGGYRRRRKSTRITEYRSGSGTPPNFT